MKTPLRNETTAAKPGAVALAFEERVIYYPAQRPGHVAWVNLFLFGNGDMGLSFTETRRAPNPRFIPPSIDFVEAFSRPYKFSALLCAAQPNLLSEAVYMKSSDAGATWQETGRSWGKSAYLAGYPDGRMVRVLYNQQAEHYERGLDRFYTPVEESCDGGNTWTQIARLLEGSGFAPFRVKKLRDGSLIALGGLSPSFGPGGSRPTSVIAMPGERIGVGQAFMFSPDAGYHWTGPHYVFQGLATPEPDFVELADGRLLFINSSVQAGPQVWQIVHRQTNGFLCEPVTDIHDAGADNRNTQSGIVPETVDITPDGLIVGARRQGGYACSSDLGQTWHGIENTNECKYQPQGVCLPDGRFMAAWHLGTDAPFGQQDMCIGLASFRFEVNLPQATRLTLERVLSDDASHYLNTHQARLTVAGKPVSGRTVTLYVKSVWRPDSTYNATPIEQTEDVRVAVTNDDGMATFALSEREAIRDIHDGYFVQASFTPASQDNVAPCRSASYSVHTLTGKRATPYTHPIYFANWTLFLSAPAAKQYPELLGLVERIDRFDEDATLAQWAKMIGSASRAQEIVEFLLANHILTRTEDDKYRWYRAVHCGPKIVENVRVDDVPDYNV